MNLKKRWEERDAGVKTIIKKQKFEIMRANYTNHAFYIIPDAIDWGALWGVAIAKTVSTYDKLIYGIVVFFFDFSSGVQQVVSQCVKFGEVHSQVGDL